MKYFVFILSCFKKVFLDKVCGFFKLALLDNIFSSLSSPLMLSLYYSGVKYVSQRFTGYVVHIWWAGVPNVGPHLS